MLKVQIPIYNQLLLKTWKVPKFNKTTSVVYNLQGIKTGIKESISRQRVITNINGDIITEEEYKLLGEPEEFKVTYLSKKDYITTIKENKEYFKIKNEYIHLINRFRENESDQFIGGMPIQLEKKCMSVLLKENNGKLVYGITLKADGVRHLMFLSKSGVIYFIDRITNFFYFKIEEQIVGFKPSTNQFLFDGELIFHKEINRWEFLIFDVIYFNNFTMFDNYYIRQQIINNVLKEIINPINIASNGFLDISVKSWYSIDTMLLTDNIYKFIIDDTNLWRKKLNNRPPLKEDGLILQPFDESYVPFREWNVYNNIQFKWKPPSQLTIDFKIRIVKPNEWWLLTKTGQVFQIKQPNGENVNAICVPTNKDKKIYKDSDVIEFKLKETNNSQNNIFVPIHIREDKTEGNSYNTAMSTMEVIKNYFTLDEIKPAIAVIKLNLPDKLPLLELYPKSKLILCYLKVSKTLFFDEDDIKQITQVYNTYVSKKMNKIFKSDLKAKTTKHLGRITSIRGLPVPQINEEDEEDEVVRESRIRKILKNRIELYPPTNRFLKNNYELEFRIFPYIAKSLKGEDEKKTINKGMYFYLLSFLFKSGYKFISSFTIDVILNEYNPTGKYRSTYKDISLTNPDNEFKEKVKDFEGEDVNFIMKPTNKDKLYNNLTLKLNLSNEIKTVQQIKLKTELHDRVVYNTTRIKKRLSFNIHPFWRLDITRVITNNGKIDLNGNETYEIECEYIGGIIPVQEFLISMNYVYTLVLMNSGYCF